MLIKSSLLVVFICWMLTGIGQYTVDKVMGPKNQELADSLKKSEYPYLFPIWGKKVVAKGFNIPKSAGLSMQYVFQTSDIVIENLSVGFNNGPMHSLEDIIRFNSSTATTSGINLRPDLWVFPFLNVYAIFAQSKTETAIDAGVWLPDSSSTWKQITSIKTKANFDATTFGFGLTPTVGIRGYFLALDMNFSWSDIEELAEPAFAFVFGPRFGKNIPMKKKDMSLALWAGGFRVQIGSATTGSLSASDLLPVNEWEEKVNTGYANVAEKQANVDSWWNGLSPAEQKNPVNIAKHEAANAVLGRFGNVLNQASQIVNNAGNGSVQYSLSKKQKQMWNFIVGAQYQLNRNWMIRAEYGFLGARQQFIGGLQWRFNL